jgi:hypothetical protein
LILSGETTPAQLDAHYERFLGEVK